MNVINKHIAFFEGTDHSTKTKQSIAKNGIRKQNHSPSHIFHGSFSNMTDICQERRTLANTKSKRMHSHQPGKRVSPGAPSFSASYWKSRPSLLYTAVKPDPGDPLIYCSSVQESEGGREGLSRTGGEWEETEVEEGEREVEGGRGRGRAACCCHSSSDPIFHSIALIILPLFVPITLFLIKGEQRSTGRTAFWVMDCLLRCMTRWAERPGYKSNLINSLQHWNSAKLIWKTLVTVPPSFGSRQSGETFHNGFHVCLQKESFPHHRLMSDEPLTEMYRVHTCRKDKHKHSHAYTHTRHYAAVIDSTT